MGYGIIDIATEILPEALKMFPSTYKVVGSRSSIAPGTVRLVLESDDIAGGGTVPITCSVRDAGSTRTIRMEPIQ